MSGAISSGGGPADGHGSGGFASSGPSDGHGSGGAVGPGMAGAGMRGPGMAGAGMGGPEAGHGSGGADFNSGFDSSGSSPGMGPAGSFGGSSGGGAGGLFGFDPASLAGAFAGPKKPAAQRFPSSYGEQAPLAFKQGYEKLAHELYMAHLALEPDSAEEAYGKARFSMAMRRPLWNLRIGMALTVKTYEGFDGKYDPITVNTSGGTGNSGGGRAPSMGSGMGMGLPSPGAPGGSSDGGTAAAVLGDSIAELPSVLGLFAEVTGEMLDRRFANGDFGRAFSSYSKPAAPAPAAGAGRGPGMQPGMGMGMGMGMDGSAGMAPPGYPGMDDPDDSGPSLGAPGMGGPGMGGPGMSAPGMAGPGMNGMGGGGQARSAMMSINQLEPKKPQWRPGVVYLGQNNVKDAFSQAESAGVDVLLMFDVSIDKSREDVRNDTRLRVFIVSNPKQTFSSSKRLTNLEVKNRNRSGDASPKKMVEEAVQPLFDDIDRKLALVDLPALNSDQAKKRIGMLLGDPNMGPIDVLAEVQLYRHLDLLGDEDVLVATELLFGDDGLKLIAASKPIRREVAESLQKPLREFGEIGLPDPAMAGGGNQGNGNGFGGMQPGMNMGGGMQPGMSMGGGMQPSMGGMNSGDFGSMEDDDGNDGLLNSGGGFNSGGMGAGGSAPALPSPGIGGF
jgi:hypothetical protein